MKVKVFRNLHKPGMVSIRNAKTNLTIGYANSVLLSNAYTRVQQGGNARTRETKQKTVHAFIIGELEDATGLKRLDGREIELRLQQTFEPIEEAASDMDSEALVLFYDPHKVTEFKELPFWNAHDFILAEKFHTPATTYSLVKVSGNGYCIALP